MELMKCLGHTEGHKWKELEREADRERGREGQGERHKYRWVKTGGLACRLY